MDLTPFAVTLVLVVLPLLGLLAAAAWAAERGVGRVRVVDRSGRRLAEVILSGRRAGG